MKKHTSYDVLWGIVCEMMNYFVCFIFDYEKEFTANTFVVWAPFNWIVYVWLACVLHCMYKYINMYLDDKL